MKGTTTYAMTWLATSLAVSVAIIVTQDSSPLWAMLIPLFITGKFEN